MKLLRALIILTITLSIIMVCKRSSRIISKDQGPTDESVESLYIEPLNIPAVDQSHIDLEKITYLQRTGEISEGFSNEEYNFFAKITDLCIDKENNLYVADSKLHKIFKFNKNQEFLISFGREGQGPGEFTGRLRISAGNDGNIYITDDRNFRLLIFSPWGRLIRQYRLPRNLYDIALANSRGEIFLLSKSGLKIIDCFDSSFKYIRSFLGIDYYLYFPYERPNKKTFQLFVKKLPNMMEVLKLISRDDHFFVIFNNSQTVVQFDPKYQIVKQFRINHPRFIKDYIERLGNAKKEGAWINCFGSVFLDIQGNICFCYYNGDLAIPEIYRYRDDGKFIDTIRIKHSKARSNRIVRACDSIGNFYGLEHEASRIVIYR